MEKILERGENRMTLIRENKLLHEKVLQRRVQQVGSIWGSFIYALLPLHEKQNRIKSSLNYYYTKVKQ